MTLIYYEIQIQYLKADINESTEIIRVIAPDIDEALRLTYMHAVEKQQEVIRGEYHITNVRESQLEIDTGSREYLKKLKAEGVWE